MASEVGAVAQGVADTGEAEGEPSTAAGRWAAKFKSGYFERQLAELSKPRTPRTPRTPLLGRSSSSAYNSPGAVFRTDDETLVLELGSRYFSAGLAGEAKPRCRGSFGPERRKRAGSHGPSLLEVHTSHSGTAKIFEDWGKGHELWNMDLRAVDLRLIGDKIERAVREALLTDLLIVDNKSRHIMLVIPSLMPHPLLSTILNTIFNLHPAPLATTLLPSPLMSAVAAGLRSALVVDIGWYETTVTAIYEYREIQQRRTSRGMKFFTWEMNRVLKSKIESAINSKNNGSTSEDANLSFEETEQIVIRMAWCEKMRNAEETSQPAAPDSTIVLPIQSGSSQLLLSMPFSDFAKPAENILFPSKQSARDCDDHEAPLPLLTFNTLLALPIDIRQTCLSRIVITGGGANIPGVKGRLLTELSHLIETRGWDPVHNYGSATARRRPTAPKQEEPAAVGTDEDFHVGVTENSAIPAHRQPQVDDARVRAYLRAYPMRNVPPAPLTESTAHPPASDKGRLRCISSLGAWAGASLLAGLKVQGVVEIGREQFLKHNLAGAERDPRGKEPSLEKKAQQQRQSLARRTTGDIGEKTTGPWTLGSWG